MASYEIKSLIKFLQNNGGLVLSGRTKFTVTATIMHDINSITQSIKDDLFVSKITTSDLISKYSRNDELLFLYDFIKKIPKLKITHSTSSRKVIVDISDFTSLRFLEIFKLNVKDVKGIQNLRERLEVVICFRCLEKIGDLLLNSVSTRVVNCLWSKLRYLVLSRNDLQSLDESFIHTPWLQYLDLSYNQLKDIRLLTCLSHLTHLNVSFNHLTEVPKFAMHKLKVLWLNNNHITDLSGVASLESLYELNISDNCVADHACLIALAELPLLRSLNLLRNPVNYHPMYRRFTCGYLHENIANLHFLLDGQSLSRAEREFIRYSSRDLSNIWEASKEKTVEAKNSQLGANVKSRRFKIKSKSTKKPRIPKINETYEIARDYDMDTSVFSTDTCSVDEDSDDDSLKKQTEDLRAQFNKNSWLPKADIEFEIFFPNQSDANSDGKTLFSSSFPKVSCNSVVDEFSLLEQGSKIPFEPNRECDGDSSILVPDLMPSSTYTSESEESSDEEDPLLDDNLWVVEKVDDEKKDPRFLVLNDFELREIDTVKQKVMVRWSIDSIERYTKISSDPFTLTLHFNAFKRENRFRKYIMEFADAKVLMSRINSELEVRHLNDQIVLKCIKCDSVFCCDKPKRKLIEDNEPIYVCPTCHSTAVIQEDLSDVDLRKPDGTPKKDNVNNKTTLSEITTSPSLSSIGSEASMDQNADVAEYDVNSYHESDVEIISNPSDSSVDVTINEHNGSSEVQRLVLGKLSERLSISELSTNDLESVQTTINQVLTESSSSGSMTDSSCTTIESNYYLCSKPHRVSQSTITSDQILLEESSTETSHSPQLHSQRRQRPKSSSRMGKQPKAAAEANDLSLRQQNSDDTANNATAASFVKLDRIDIKSYVGSALEGVWSKMLPSPLSSGVSQEATVHKMDPPLKYSYTDFSFVDYRIKTYLWRDVIPDSEEIIAFIRAPAASRSNQPTVFFQTLIALTNKKLYLVKVTSEIENEDDYDSWLENWDDMATEKLTLVRPLLWKQGFCIETKDRMGDGSCLQYHVLLYDEKRTNNFLRFLEDRGVVHVQTDVSSDKSSARLIQIDEDIRNLTISDRIQVLGTKEEKTCYDFVALVVTYSKFFILKGDAEWLLPESTISPTIIREEKMSDLISIKSPSNGITFLFLDEFADCERTWIVKTVSSDASEEILKAIKEPWEELFGITLLVATE